MEFSHYSVLLNECIEALNIAPDGIYIDGTARRRRTFPGDRQTPDHRTPHRH